MSKNNVRFKRGDRVYIKLHRSFRNADDFLKEHRKQKGIWVINNICKNYDDGIWVKSKSWGEWWILCEDCDTIILLSSVIKENLPEELFKI